jgi:hypothetical protein
MKVISTRVIMVGAAGVLGVALAAGGAYTARGSITVADVPGTVLQVSGVGSASAEARLAATAHTSPGAKGLPSATTAHPTVRAATHATSQAPAIPQSGVRQVAPPAPQMLPMHPPETHSPGPAHSSSHL